MCSKMNRNGELESMSELESSDSDSSSSYESYSSIERRPCSTGMVWETDKYGEFINISCASNQAQFYKDRFARGSVGHSVLFEGEWMTLNKFQSVSGRQSSKDWKKSIRTNGRCLKELVSEGMLTEHSKSCSCSLCTGQESLRKEGELALAAKKRRLSQADSTRTVTRTVSFGENKTESTRNISDKKVWSPSGEVAQDGSSNEDEYRPKVDSDEAGAMHPNSVIDISDFIPRRSRRSANRRNKGHRTELGTFTTKPANWDSEEVAEFLRLQGFSEYATPFLQCGIDGQSLFLLKEHHLFERFHMRLGPALCLLDKVGRLRHPPLS